jgi:hypothetical protein
MDTTFVAQGWQLTPARKQAREQVQLVPVLVPALLVA